MVSPTLANEREMRPDQDPDEVSSRNQCCRTVDKPRDPDRTRDLFGLQLEVTSLLLEAERRKLSVLQRELQAALAEGGSIKAKEQQKHELILAISRIQGQHEQLEKEYRQHAIGVLRCSNTRGSGKSNRSQPAIGLKQTPKARVSTHLLIPLSSERVCHWLPVRTPIRPQGAVSPRNERLSARCRAEVQMEDHEIQETVESILGKGAKVVDCEKRSCIREEEVLLVNGCPVSLDGDTGNAIRTALLQGVTPPCDLLNELLVRAGILKAPVKLETSLSVKSSVVTKENVSVSKDGHVVDERSREVKEDNFYSSTTSEVWEPVRRAPVPPANTLAAVQAPKGVRGGGATSSNSSGCWSALTGDDVDLTNGLENLSCASTPTIFGTVASDQTPKDGSSRRSLPQTPQSAKSFSTLINGPIGDAAASESGGSLDSVHDIQPSDENALVYKDGNLVSGPLDALLQHMVPTSDYFPDRAYLFAFLLSARLFIKPHELLGQVCQRCHIHKPESITAPAQFVRHIVQLLAEWTETFPYDFRDERVMAHVRELTQQCVALEPTVRREVSQLLQNLLHRLTALEQYEEFLQRINSETATPNIESLNVSDITELCPSPEKLAQQLTHIELERLSFIGPEEFVQAFAKENTKPETTSFRDLKKTRNLESYVQWFNRLSYFVATEVCKHVKKKARVRAVEYWVEVARECFNIGNFNSLMGIIAGLNMSPVSRLKKTWAKVSSGKFAILEHQMDPSSNFSSYRSTLKAAMWRSAGATDERQRIVIPFFSLLVKDLYFLNEGCASKLPSGHVNFEKCWQLAKQVTEFIAWKQVACPFAKDAKVTNFLQSTTVLSDEKALAIASFECEPPENSFEKERYKNLKAEINGTTSSTT
ncbi:Hypothetical predicted protein [Cloeon dipterum]|uniref:Ras-GEF domain-containing protein n=1 Tax=Cloeon dipterum TaxID=197152 RepID=A0A8S1BXY3_9INSE|nr:Hypothetical predicted protein [Cloeon dipterum]